MTAPLLEAREVRKQFGAVVAADSISARVHRGEIIGVIGANGAGKTTFVNMLTGHLAPDSGDFFFEGKNITGMPSCDIVRAGINRSFQISQVFSEMSVADNLAAAVALFGGEGGMWRPAISADVVRRAEELMRRFAIEEWRSHTAATLPQGARKCLDNCDGDGRRAVAGAVGRAHQRRERRGKVNRHGRADGGDAGNKVGGAFY